MCIDLSALDDILIQWHKWCRSYHAIAPIGSSPMFREATTGRQWDSIDDVISREIDNDRMATVDFYVGELAPAYRTALQINARNLASGRAVWKSHRLPVDADERMLILLEARNALSRKLIDAGIMG